NCHRQPKGIIKFATISQHSSGKYYISLKCKEEIIELPKTNSTIGIDLSIMDSAILSDAQKIDNNKLTSKIEKKLKHE
ncbi:RNA-guided endonuclease TnpB family protein, partial [Enterococcus faecium]